MGSKKSVYSFPKGMTPKVKIKVRLEFELFYLEDSVLHFSHYANETLSLFLTCRIIPSAQCLRQKWLPALQNTNPQRWNKRCKRERREEAKRKQLFNGGKIPAAAVVHFSQQIELFKWGCFWQRLYKTQTWLKVGTIKKPRYRKTREREKRSANLFLDMIIFFLSFFVELFSLESYLSFFSEVFFLCHFHISSFILSAFSLILFNSLSFSYFFLPLFYFLSILFFKEHSTFDIDLSFLTKYSLSLK